MMWTVNAFLRFKISEIISMKKALPKINKRLEKVDGRIESLERSIETLNGRMDRGLTSVIVLLISVIVLLISVLFFGYYLKQDINIRFEEINVDFKDLHNFGRDRYLALALISKAFTTCNQISTSHAVNFNGRVTEIVVNHHDCRKNLGGPPKDVIICENLDLGLKTECPVSHYILNISKVQPLVLGDEVVCYGHEKILWKGHLSSENSVPINGKPWEGDIIIKSNEYAFHGEQHVGMSGGAVLNGCGYVGMAHAVGSEKIKDVGKFTFVIPATEIQQCITKNSKLLKNISQCPGRTVIESPMLRSCFS